MALTLEHLFRKPITTQYPEERLTVSRRIRGNSLAWHRSRCTGCYTCVVACKDWYDVPAGPAAWLRVKTIEKGKYPNPFVAYLPTFCYHCAKPGCMDVCPADAITKRAEDGIVVVDQEKCLGRDACGVCKAAIT